MRATFLISVLCCGIFTGSAVAQAERNFYGKVVDERSGRPIGGVYIWVVNLEAAMRNSRAGKQVSTISDKGGNFILRTHFKGRCVLNYSRPGFNYAVAIPDPPANKFFTIRCWNKPMPPPSKPSPR